MGQLLSEDAADHLVTVCRTAMGDSLRSVTFFTRDDYEQLYLRSDLEQDADLMSFIGHEWYDFKNTEEAYRDSELGDHRFTVRAFDNGYLVRVATDREGTFVTTDGLTLQSFEEAATAIEKMLRDR